MDSKSEIILFDFSNMSRGGIVYTETEPANVRPMEGENAMIRELRVDPARCTCCRQCLDVCSTNVIG